MNTVNEIMDLVEFYAQAEPTRDKYKDYAELKAAIEEFVARIDKDMQDWYRLHYLMKKYGWHPGRTDDDLLEILDEKIEELHRDARRYQFIRGGGAFIAPNEYDDIQGEVYMDTNNGGKYYQDMRDFDMDLDAAIGVST